ncbi:hypothetical protein HF319_01550 [Xanthomonas sp. Kuri4-1]
MGIILDKLNLPFARKWGALIAFATALLFLTNPELLSAVLLVNTIGVDVFILLVGMQLRQHWEVVSSCMINPCCLRIKRLFDGK